MSMHALNRSEYFILEICPIYRNPCSFITIILKKRNVSFEPRNSLVVILLMAPPYLDRSGISLKNVILL